MTRSSKAPRLSRGETANEIIREDERCVRGVADTTGVGLVDILSGKDNGTGVGLVEAYNLP